jgi:tripartite ATP-independent transporter DctM subunit
MLTWVVGAFVGTVVLGFPISFVLGFSTMIPFWVFEQNLLVIPQRLITGIDSFPLMAIPFFILAGEVMTASGITERIALFATAVFGYMRGGLAHMNVAASMIFAGIQGSGVADAAGLGPIEIRIMLKGGYDLRFSAAITTASAVLGPIIPPSIAMVIYAVAEPSVSIAAMFLAGIFPGILLGGALMVYCYVISWKRDYPVLPGRLSLHELTRSFLAALPALLMPLIILGGILSGLFTATEAGAVATVYALLFGTLVMRTLHLRDIPGVFLRSGVTTSVVLLMVGMASGLSWLLATMQVPQKIVALILGFSNDPRMFLLCVNLLLLLAGMVMDVSANLIIFVPILAPVADLLGINPLHFAIVVVLNLCIGMITPPVGTVLFVICSVTKLSMESLVRELWPFIMVEIAVLGLITYAPAMTLVVPRLLGY